MTTINGTVHGAPCSESRQPRGAPSRITPWYGPLCWATATVETVVFDGGSSVTV
ncbi:hypothetical protein K4749_13435 [Streptomyces sp. TRM72054]|uniref:hypothetical protein n=1 Tax=Streptomyces sp. TRM72054 TaxID=2870562 RepID=UPI001C8B1240|nr:hypothetical protein [Streptomyces sp. TRM72054]MBX9394578.1 hypothetical protein [Streptomyces sp. TRM72054]